MKKKKKSVIQQHHIIYPSEKNKELTVKVTKGEHRILSLLQWYCRKRISKGFIKALDIYLAINRDRSIELEVKE